MQGLLAAGGPCIPCFSTTFALRVDFVDRSDGEPRHTRTIESTLTSDKEALVVETEEVVLGPE